MITSRSNARVVHIRRLLNNSKYRKKSKELVVESIKLIQDIMFESPHTIQDIYIKEGVECPHWCDKQPIYLSAQVFSECTTLTTSVGIIAVIQSPKWTINHAEMLSKTVVICDGISDPSNLGAMIRNVAAFDGHLLVLMPNCADPYHPRAMRAATTGFGKVPIIFGTDCIENLIQNQYHFIFCDVTKGVPLYSIQSRPERLAVVFGSEGQGITSSTLKKIDQCSFVTVPMVKNIDSLNVAVSSGIILSWLFTL